MIFLAVLFFKFIYQLVRYLGSSVSFIFLAFDIYLMLTAFSFWDMIGHAMNWISYFYVF